ncbi:hypothetical protein QQF64_025695, partial [Cirrhinus molitorella]
SKHLALKLKDKKNDVETLKKEFNLFWEQSVKKIFTDTPSIKNIDIMKDVRAILSNIYESVPVGHWKISSKHNNVINVDSYSDYVQLKKFKDKFKGWIGFGPLSKDDEVQIRSLVTDVSQQTDKMIQSFNISKMGYNISCIQQLTDYIKARIMEHEGKSVKYVFKNDFFMDLVLFICMGAKDMINDQHKLFSDANDPTIYVEKKRDEYYIIFKKYCHGATS